MQNDRFETPSTARNDSASSQAQPPKQKKRTTAIALSVITCLFMCVIGFEIVSMNKDKDEDGPVSKKSSKPHFVFTKKDGRGDVAIGKTSNAFESATTTNKQLSALQELNRQQAEKIWALRQDLAETNKRLNVLTANGKVEESHAAPSKSAELTRLIAEQERLNASLNSDIKELENELAESKKNINQLKLSIEALTLMLDERRATSDQAALRYEEKLAEAQKMLADAESQYAAQLQQKEAREEEERKHLTQVIEETELARSNLEKMVAEEKAKAQELLQHLQNELDTTERAKSENDGRIQTMEQQLAGLEQSLEDLSKQLQAKGYELQELDAEKNNQLAQAAHAAEAIQRDLEHKLVAEQTRVQELQNDLQAAVEAKNNGGTRIQLLEEQLASMMSSLEESIAQLQLAHANTATEREHAALMERRLLDAQEKIGSLELTVHSHVTELNLKTQDMEHLQTGLERDLQKHQEQIAQLTENLENLEREKTHAEATIANLNQELTTAKLVVEERDQHVHSMETAFAARVLQLEAALQSHEQTIAAKTAEIESLISTFGTNSDHFHQQIAQLNDQLEQSQKNHSQELSLQQAEHARDLEALRNEMESYKQSAEARQEEIIVMSADHIRNEDKAKSEISLLLSELENQKTETESERLKRQQLHEDISSITARLEAEQKHAQQLEQLLQETAQKSLALESEMESHKSQHHEAVSNLKSNHEDEVTNLKGISLTLEQQLQESAKQMADLHEELVAHKEMLDTRQQQIVAMEEQQSLGAEELRNTIAQLSAELEEYRAAAMRESENSRMLQQERDEIVAKMNAELENAIELEGRLKNADQHHITMKEQFEAHQEHLENLHREQQQSLTQENVTLATELAKLQELVQAMQADVGQTTEKFVNARQNAEAIENQLKEALDRIAVLEKENEAIKANAAESETATQPRPNRSHMMESHDIDDDLDALFHELNAGS